MMLHATWNSQTSENKLSPSKKMSGGDIMKQEKEEVGKEVNIDNSNNWNCPYLVKCYGGYLSEDNAHACIVMEYMKGGSLQQLIQKSSSDKVKPDKTVSTARNPFLPCCEFGFTISSNEYPCTVPTLPPHVCRYNSFYQPKSESHDAPCEDDKLWWGVCPESWLAEVAHDVLHGLAYLSRRRRIHRDIKPGNLLIDENGKVFVISYK